MAHFQFERLSLLLSLVIGITLFSIQNTFANQNPEERYALVIGNSNYNGKAILPNAVNDSRAIRDKFKALGFRVVYGENLSWEGTHKLIKQFIQFSPKMDKAAFFYAGHAVQINNTNFMVTIDYDSSSHDKVVESLWPLTPLLEDINDRSHVGLVFLDACRDNPFSKEIKQVALQNPVNLTRSLELINHKYQALKIAPKKEKILVFRSVKSGNSSVADTKYNIQSQQTARTFSPPEKLKAGNLSFGHGLAKVKLKEGMFLAFASAPGEVAIDGRSKHSPFTEGMLKYLTLEAVTLSSVFKRVRRHVLKKTNGLQVPWEENSLIDDVFLNGVPFNPQKTAYSKPDKDGFSSFDKKLTPENDEVRLNIPDIKENDSDLNKAKGNAPSKNVKKNRFKKKVAPVYSRKRIRSRKRKKEGLRNNRRTKQTIRKRIKSKARKKKSIGRTRPRTTKTKRKTTTKKTKRKTTTKKTKRKMVKRSTRTASRKKRTASRRKKSKRTVKRTSGRRNSGGSPTGSAFIGVGM